MRYAYLSQEVIDFSAVPEVKPGEALTLIEQLAALRGSSSPHYGAYVIRAAGVSLAEECILHYADLAGRPGDYDSKDFSKATADGLHVDPGVSNDLTVHVTTQGSAEAIIVVSPDISIDPGKAANKQTGPLFAAGMYTGYDPAIAYRTVVDRGDIIFFDSTQLHAFSPLGTDRAATAYYIDI